MVLKIDSGILEDSRKPAPGKVKIGMSEERLMAQIPHLRKRIAFWRKYPDLFIDFLCGPGSKFQLFFYQRLFLRAAMRHRYFYATFTRAFSKSFLSVMILMIRCILYPNAKLFICSGGKEQAASIAKEKIEEICDLIPAMKKEIDWRTGKSLFGKDYVRLEFKNGSRLDIVAVRESTRGGRRTGGLIEEAILIDGEKLNTVILPLMNVSRRLPDGSHCHEEVINKSQIWVTTAGFKNTFAYDKLIQMLIWQIVKPGLAFTMGGSWRVPVKMGLLDRGFVNDLKADGTFDEVSFEREYESKWAGSSLGAFYNAEQFDKLRTLAQPEYEVAGRGNGKHYYVFGIDVARSKEGCQSVVCVFKVNPSSGGGASNKSLVNIFTINTAEESGHFGRQSMFIKRLYNKYFPRAIAVDGNGLGHGLVDFLTISNTDNSTGEDFPAFGVINDEDGDFRKLQKSEPRVIKDVLYIVKANGEINDICHTNVLAQMGSSKIKFLADERTAKAKLLGTKIGQAMEPSQRAEFLRPFVLTSILKTEMMNLIEKREGKNLFLERNNKGIPKDKFSAFEYGLYYIKITEDESRKKRKIPLKNMMLYSKGGRR